MDKTLYMGRAAVARALGVGYGAVDKVMASNGINRHKLPGHRYYFFPAAAVNRLARQFEAGEMASTQNTKGKGE